MQKEMINTIRLKNWKCHEDSVLSLSKGTNVFIGDMGSGKSSVVDAVCFALYGTFPALKGRRVRLEDVVMSRPRKAERALVELEFDINGKKYSVTRSVSAKKSSEVQLRIDGKLVEAQPVRANEVLEEALGMDYDLFSRAVYAEQNRIDYLLVVPKGDRKQQTDELLGLTRFEEVRGNAVTLANRMSSRKAEADNFLKGADAGRRRQELEKARQEEKESGDAVRKLAAESDEAALRASNARTKVSELQEAEAQARQKRLALARAEAELESLKKQASEAAGAQRSRAEVEAGIAECSKQMAAGEERLSVAAQRLAELQAEEAAVKKSVEALESVKGAECPVCGAAISEEGRAHLKKERANKLAELRELIASARSGRQAAEKFAAGQRALSLALRNELDRLEAAEKIAGMEKEAASKAEGCRKEFAELMKSFSEERVVSARAELIAAESVLSALKRDVENARTRLEEKKKAIGEAERRIKEIDEKENEAREYQKRAEKAQAFARAVVETQSELREQLIGAINDVLLDLWTRVYPYANYTQARVRALEDDYAVELLAGDGWQPVDCCSGGERSCAALALRMAFATVLAPNLNWLVLDEPTHNLDAHAVALLNRALHDELPEIISQIIVITHEDALKEGASSKVFFFERDKENSERTVVEEITA